MAYNPSLQKVENPSGDSVDSWAATFRNATNLFANVGAQVLQSQLVRDRAQQPGGETRPVPTPWYQKPAVLIGGGVGLVLVLVLVLRRK